MKTNILTRPPFRLPVHLVALGALLCGAAASQAAEPDRVIKVGVTAPATNFKVEVTGVYQVGGELWVVSKMGKVGDFGAGSITKVSATVVVKAADLPEGKFAIKRKVLGKTWNWETAKDGVEHVAKDAEAKFKKTLAAAKKVPFERKAKS